ncbi:MAG: phosphosugar isomerase [Spirochaetae bacterium HGW-Spirochaetae-4]|jgi:fructoselysine-6-P-deglycase FrlB-like protein|nr:MAG: phosphosugar isomerase [Spirochaetae bacterium HGW-Spirochaetae-4]
MQEMDIIRAILDDRKKTGNTINKVYFAACGGSIAALYPSKYLLEKESVKLNRVGYYSSNEFVLATPSALDKNSLVIACSHQGDTPETVEAIKLAQQRGAATVAFTYKSGSEITEYGDYEIVYDWGPESSPANQKASRSLKLVGSLLKELEDWKHYGSFIEGFDRLDTVVKRASEQLAEYGSEFADANKLEKVIYTVGSGANFGSAYMEDICILKEMQWIHSSSIHSGEFFHGPLEITDTETPFLLMLGDGRTRAMDERVLTFLKRYGRKIYLLDVRDLGISVIDESVVEYFSPLLLNNVVGVLNKALAVAKKHPLSTRRYMWKVSY